MLKVIFFDIGETLVTKDKQLIMGVKAMLAALHQKGIRFGIISKTGNLTRAEVVKIRTYAVEIPLNRAVMK